MSQPELLIRVIDVLDAAGLPYMLTGSLASSIQGHPRATHDIDLVVDMTAAAVKVLASAFPPPEFYFSELAAREAIESRSMFNLLVPGEDDKVDFWLLKDDPFDKVRFARRVTHTYRGKTIYVTSAEDTIVSKLMWSKMSGGSEKQFTDCLRVYEAQAGTLDLGYIERWVDRLGVESLWHRLLREAKPIES